jgi:hypothetical protein
MIMPSYTSITKKTTFCLVYYVSENNKGINHFKKPSLINYFSPVLHFQKMLSDKTNNDNGGCNYLKNSFNNIFTHGHKKHCNNMVEILHLFENMYKIGQHSDFYPT